MFRKVIKWALIALGALFVIGAVSNMATGSAPESDQSTDTTVATDTGTPFTVFVGHVTPQATSLVGDLGSLGDAANAMDIEATTDAAIDLWINAGAEVDWLEANPPQDCYADVHAKYLAATDELERAGDLISDGWIASDLVEQGSAALTEGGALATEVTGLLETTSCAA